MITIDVLIIGQGLAGSLLAWELLQRGFRILVVDPGLENASRVAAGLINPVTGQRLVKCAMVEILLQAAQECYRRLAAHFQQTFFVDMPMWRVLQNQKEQDYAKLRLKQTEYANFFSWYDTADNLDQRLNAEFGILRQMQTGYVRTGLLLNSIRENLLAHGSYRLTQVNYHDIKLRPELSWLDVRPKHIVFCEGHLAKVNPWFGGLPFQPAKGEILSCHTAVVCPAQILNYGHWLIPLDRHSFKTGATFDPLSLNTQPTKLAETQLLSALQRLIPELTITGISAHKAGIRPATLDKKPFIGAHPLYSNLHIFNGFGAKGCLTIPWYAQQFTANLSQQSAIPAYSHIRRYYASHYFT